MSKQHSYNYRIHCFAVLTAMATLFLIGLGGIVTSKGVGMAVPDWPNTYGYNMFFFPFSNWVGGILWEHSHRLFAAGVGLMTMILCLWLFGKSARSFLRFGLSPFFIIIAVVCLFPKPRWQDVALFLTLSLVSFGTSFVWPRCSASSFFLRGLGTIAFVGVIFQGILGGLRVTWFEFSNLIGVFHAAIAQLFFVLMTSIALLTSRWWGQIGNASFSKNQDHQIHKVQNEDHEIQNQIRNQVYEVCEVHKDQNQNYQIQNRDYEVYEVHKDQNQNYQNQNRDRSKGKSLATCLLLLTFLIFAQLILGASMRHQHAGLAVSEFPLIVYGKLWPATDEGSISRLNRDRIDYRGFDPITKDHILLHMMHRIGGGVLFFFAVILLFFALRKLPKGHWLGNLLIICFASICLQALLGAATIWSNKAADIATLHVVLGALTFALFAILSMIVFRLSKPVYRG